MATRKQLRRAASAAKTDAQSKRKSASLLGPPREFFQKIHKELATDGEEILRPSSSRQAVNRVRKSEPSIPFKSAYKRLHPLIAVSKQLRDECYEYLGQETTLEEPNSNTLLFQHKTAYWSKPLLVKMRKVKVGVSFGMKLKPDQMWPQYLQFFIKLMPKLIHLELYTDFYLGDSAYPKKLSGEPLGDVERSDQERRCKLFFLAYLTQRHPSLNRIILPAASGPTWEEGHNEVHHYLIAERSFDKTPGDRDFVWDEKTKKSSEGVNATVHEDEPQPGQTKDVIFCSEVAYDDQRFWQMVDSRPYQPDLMRTLKGWKNHSADEIIDFCKELPRREQYAAIAVAAAAEAGGINLGQRDAMTRARRAFQVRARGWANPEYRQEHKYRVNEVYSRAVCRQNEVWRELMQEKEAAEEHIMQEKLAKLSRVIVSDEDDASEDSSV